MVEMYLQDIIKATGAKSKFPKDYNPLIGKIEKDSRLVDKTSIYLAIIGENLDGHKFIPSALENGAIAALSQNESEDDRVLVVENTYQALKDIAIYYLKRYSIKRFAVTGSSGKTTTKDMLYYALSEAGNTLRNEGNLNSEIGLPLTVLNLDSKHEYGIFEMGMYNFGEIQYLADIIRPEIAIITNIGKVHLMQMKTQENIFKAKMEIAEYMGQGDILVVNGDDKYLCKVKEMNKPYKVVTYGFGDNCDYKVKSYEETNEGYNVKTIINNEEKQFFVPVLGIHNISNAMSIVAACTEAGIEFEKISKGISQFKPSGLRMEIKNIGNKLIINDCYNANPDSMEGTIPVAVNMAKERMVMVLGDMRELGDISEKCHRDLGKNIADKADVLIAVGKEMEYAAEEAIKNGLDKSNVHCFKNATEAAEKINDLLRENDTVFIKGSRGIALEQVVDIIK